MVPPPPLTQDTNALIKLHLGDKGIRRIAFRKLWNSDSDTVSFQSLADLAIQYSGCQAEDIVEVTITYIDEDGDSITISSDEELTEAFEQFVDKVPPVVRASAKVKAPGLEEASRPIIPVMQKKMDQNIRTERCRNKIKTCKGKRRERLLEMHERAKAVEQETKETKQIKEGKGQGRVQIRSHKGQPCSQMDKPKAGFKGSAIDEAILQSLVSVEEKASTGSQNIRVENNVIGEVHSPMEVPKARCLAVVNVLIDHTHGWVFSNPVDPVQLGILDYFQIVKKPMDLGTIKKKMENGSYHSLKEFDADVRLIFDNAILYNVERFPVVHQMAKDMKEIYISEYRKLFTQLKKDESQETMGEKEEVDEIQENTAENSSVNPVNEIEDLIAKMIHDPNDKSDMIGVGVSATAAAIAVSKILHNRQPSDSHEPKKKAGSVEESPGDDSDGASLSLMQAKDLVNACDKDAASHMSQQRLKAEIAASSKDEADIIVSPTCSAQITIEPFGTWVLQIEKPQLESSASSKSGEMILDGDEDNDDDLSEGTESTSSNCSWELVNEDGKMMAQAAQMLGSALFQSDANVASSDNSVDDEVPGNSVVSGLASVPSITTTKSEIAAVLLTRWEDELRQLHELGFLDDHANVEALGHLEAANISDVSDFFEKVIDFLLQGQK